MENSFSSHPSHSVVIATEFCTSHKGLEKEKLLQPGPRLNIKTVLSTYGDFHVNMAIAIPGKTVFLIETAPRILEEQEYWINGKWTIFGSVVFTLVDTTGETVITLQSTRTKSGSGFLDISQ